MKAEERDFPKVSSSNPSWYLIENQPASALTQSVDKTDITLQIGNVNATINGMPYALDAAPYIKNSRTMLPVRFISEGLDSVVSWDAVERKVTINDDLSILNLWIGKSNATVGPKSINENSDADSDGLTFSAEKILGTNPNNKNTVYTTLTDKAISDILKQYPGTNFFSATPDGRCDLTLPEKIALTLDPRTPFNVDSIVDDEFALRYAASRGLSKTKENASKEIAGIVLAYGEKLGNGMKLAMGTRILAPEKADASASTAKSQVETSYSLRAYKEGTTLDALTSSERYKALMLLNNAFGEQEINLLLSQSPTLQKNNLQQYSDLVKTLQDASNATEASLGKKVKETNTFRQYVNQLGLYDYNAGELAVKMWDGANDALKAEIKSHPKTFLAITAGFGPYASANKITYEEKEYDFQDFSVSQGISEWALKLFDYDVKTEKELLSNKEGIVNKFGGLENEDFMLLKTMIPDFSFDVIQTQKTGKPFGFFRVLKEKGLYDALKSAFDITGEMEKTLEIAKNYYHDVKEQGITADWLGECGAAYVDLKINSLIKAKINGVKTSGVPYGDVTISATSPIYNTTNSEELALVNEKLKPENTPKEDKDKISVDANRISRIEDLLLKSLLIPSTKYSVPTPSANVVGLLTLEPNENFLVLPFTIKGYLLNGINYNENKWTVDSVDLFLPERINSSNLIINDYTRINNLKDKKWNLIISELDKP
ncbi:MAG: copper amine oxidase N-terminal domain-containing protein [Candidatus Woesearchaeota archaeon]|nr:copper amine oxidase N-terminal domain-containing protein [Candidatus Woesearchaeota archaeon]